MFHYLVTMVCQQAIIDQICLYKTGEQLYSYCRIFQVFILSIGITANSYWANEYGGSDYLCVSSDPEWSNKYQQQGSYYNYNGRHRTGRRPELYGTEYEEDEYFEGAGSVGSSPNDKSHTGLETIDNHDMPCVLCQTKARHAHVMIPALRDCPAGWTKEYAGYLMAEGNEDGEWKMHRSHYICVDEQPRVQRASWSNVPESTAYFVEATCGVLSCDEYPSGWELACVVCTK